MQLALIVAAGLGLRLIGAGNRLSHDEGYSWLVANAPSAGAFFDRLAATENTPPLFYATLVPLPLDSEFWLRLPSIVAGTLWIGVTYAIAATLFERRVALVAALAVAVAPFAVSYSDYSRGFMLAGLGLLLALLAAAKLATGRSRRWGAVFVAGATGALYAQYYALAFVVVLVGALLVLDRARWRLWALLGAAPLVLFAPWLGQLDRSHDNLGVTKLPAVSEAPSFAGVRDALVPLVFGEHGAAGSLGVRALQLAAVLAVAGWAVSRLRGPALWLLGGTLVGVLVVHGVVSAVETDVFRQRYLTALIPVGALAVAGALARWPRALAVAAAALVVLGGAVAVNRADREYEPDHERALALAGTATVHTNSAVIAFYGRDGDVVLDRPFGLGPGAPCGAGCAVVDDGRYGGVRPLTGPTTSVGPIVVSAAPGTPR